MMTDIIPVHAMDIWLVFTGYFPATADIAITGITDWGIGVTIHTGIAAMPITAIVTVTDIGIVSATALGITMATATDIGMAAAGTGVMAIVIETETVMTEMVTATAITRIVTGMTGTIAIGAPELAAQPFRKLPVCRKPEPFWHRFTVIRQLSGQIP